MEETGRNGKDGGSLLIRRLIAGGFDLMTLFLLFLLLVWLLNLTPLSGTARGHLDRCREIQERTVEECGGDLEKVKEILNGDPEYREELFAYELHSYLLQSAACLAAEGILFLAVPLLSRSRSTAGMRMAGLGVSDPSRWAWASPGKTVLRFLFILLPDSLMLFPWTGLLTFLLVPVLRIIQLMLSKRRKTLIDHLTGTELAETASFEPVSTMEE